MNLEIALHSLETMDSDRFRNMNENSFMSFNVDDMMANIQYCKNLQMDVFTYDQEDSVVAYVRFCDYENLILNYYVTDKYVVSTLMSVLGFDFQSLSKKLIHNWKKEGF